MGIICKALARIGKAMGKIGRVKGTLFKVMGYGYVRAIIKPIIKQNKNISSLQ